MKGIRIVKIWVIARSYPIKKNKMRGSFELEQAKLLAEAGHDVTFMALIFHPINKVKKWGRCSWKDGNIKVFTESVFYAPERMHLHLKRFQERKWRRMLEWVESETGVPDIIHIHYPAMVSDADVVIAYQKKNVSIVTTEHWSKTLNNTMDDYQRKQLIQYAECADATLCVSKPLKEAISRITGTKRDITVVPNVVSNLFKPSINKKKGFHFVAVGRLVPHKQFDRIIEAFAEAFGSKEDVFLTIVGGGNEQKLLNELIKRHNLQTRVRLEGTLTREQTAHILARSHALICYSRLETFGVPVIEGWACGLPVISSDGIGFTEYWNKNLGYIVSMNHTEELVSAMQKLYDRYDSFNAEQIHDFAQKNFGEKAVATQLNQIYQEVHRRIL